MALEKLDLFRLHKAEYAASAEPGIVEVGPASYLSVVGCGDPKDEAFGKGVRALYSVAYAVKMSFKGGGRDYKVCPLEGLWWGEGFSSERVPRTPRAEWNWKLLIRVPEFVSGADVAEAAGTLSKKKKDPALADVALETIEEGACVQALHVGPYAEEVHTIQRMLDFAKGNGLAFRGLHHEIYLSDPGRVAAEKLRTILRHPVEPASKSDLAR